MKVEGTGYDIAMDFDGAAGIAWRSTRQVRSNAWSLVFRLLSYMDKSFFSFATKGSAASNDGKDSSYCLGIAFLRPSRQL
jgi:hypothetical protein